MINVLGPLISFGCLALDDVLVNGGTIFDKLDTADQAKTKLAHGLLSLTVARIDLPDVMTAEESYRLHVKQSHLQQDNPKEALIVISRALEHCHFTHDSALVSGLAGSDPNVIYTILQRLVLEDADAVTKTLVLPLFKNDDEDISNSAIAIVDQLVAAEKYEQSRPITIEMILNLANDFTLPYCQIKLASMFAMEDASMKDKEEEGTDRLSALDNAIEEAVAAHNTSWTCIVPLLEPSIAQHLRRRAETDFLATFPSPKVSNADHGISQVQRAKNLFTIVEATSSTPPSPGSTLANETVTTISNIWQLLSATQNSTQKEQITTHWIPLLLAFITLQSNLFEPTKAGHEARAKALLSLAALMLELDSQNPKTASTLSLVEKIFDLALYLVDALPDDIRQHCIRSLQNTASNTRISYLFSVAPNPTEWLMLSQKEKSGVAGSIPQGMSGPEARALIAEKEKEKEKLSPFVLKRWEMLGESTPNVGENDTSLSLKLFGARRG